MAGRTNVVKVAYVGDAGKLVSETNKGAKSVEGFGAKASKPGKVVGVAFGGLAVGAGVGLYKLGSTFDDAYDNIRVKTGKTGTALDGLEKNFRNVFSGVP